MTNGNISSVNMPYIFLLKNICNHTLRVIEEQRETEREREREGDRLNVLIGWQAYRGDQTHRKNSLT